jgi:hypothetical protein
MPAGTRFELCLVVPGGPGAVSQADAEQGSAAMQSKKLPRVGDQVNVEGREGVFFVLNADEETRCTTLIPNDDGPILNEISVDSLTVIARPSPNRAIRA